MERKQRLFIYDRKELMVLLLLGVMVAFFAFTLGVHLGKRVGLKPGGLTQAPEVAGVATTPDHIPSKQEFQDQAKGANAQLAEDSVSQALHDEIERTGMRLDQVKQVTLPAEPKAARSSHVPPPATENPSVAAHPSEGNASQAHTASAGARRFALQIGSYPTEKDARERAAALKAPGLSPYVQEAEVKGKGKWFRVYLGSYSTKEDAEKAGEKLKSSRVIQAFVIARVANSAE